jgi:hypothetical protein
MKVRGIMITKQRKVGGSMVFTVPKDFTVASNSKGLYSVTRGEKGEIIYTPCELLYGKPDK